MPKLRKMASLLYEYSNITYYNRCWQELRLFTNNINLMLWISQISQSPSGGLHSPSKVFLQRWKQYGRLKSIKQGLSFYLISQF